MRARRELLLFGAAYLLYNAGRGFTNGDMNLAVANANWVLSLPVYALFPVAPPRLAGIGMTDAVSEQSAVALAGHSTWFYNPIAAVPSLHCGFAMAIGVAVAAAVRRPWLKVLALSWGPIVALSTVATANHYVFDVAAGLAVTGVGFLVTSRPRVREVAYA